MDIFEHIVEAKKTHEPLVLATVIESMGSAPRGAGARMLVRQDGSLVGTVGGGTIEKIVADEALKMMGTSTAKTIKHNLKDIGMECGGGMSIFLEPVNPMPQLFIFGAGHIGAVLSQIAKLLDFNVTVIDNRAEFADPEKLPWADSVVAGDYSKAIEQLPFSPNTYIVILTHKHGYDFEVLEKCIAKPHCYVGMIGSKKKVATCMKQLRENGISEATIKSINAPVGLDISANTPAEIAVSIVAQIVQARSQSDGSQPVACPSSL
jgi:xanthine dehydrogenase accessory factor